MRVALLTNFVAPYRVTLLEALRDRLGELRVLLSVPMERDRSWAVEWGSLDVVVQRAITLPVRAPDVMGLSRRLELHIPLDTIGQLSRWCPDLVISGELGARSVGAAAFCAWRQVPLVLWTTLSEHTEHLWGSSRVRLRRALLRRADVVLVNGESGARYVGGLGVAPARVARVNQPVDVALFARSDAPRPDAAPLRLLVSGMLAEHKGVRQVIDHLAEWAGRNPQRQIELWWVGDGPLRPWLERQILPPNLRQRLLGAVPYATMPGIYRQADVLVMPSLRDEWGLVVNEAMASGLPVVGSCYSQAVLELVERGCTGWVFDPLSAASSLAALDRMAATGPVALRQMGEAARRRVNGLTPAAAADHIAALGRELVANRRSRATNGAS